MGGIDVAMSAFSYMGVRERLTALPPDRRQPRPMGFRAATTRSTPPAPPGAEPAAARIEGDEALGWANRVWRDREAWLQARGGVESVFMAAQLLGCREDAVAWLRQRTRL